MLDLSSANDTRVHRRPREEDKGSGSGKEEKQVEEEKRGWKSLPSPFFHLCYEAISEQTCSPEIRNKVKANFYHYVDIARAIFPANDSGFQN